MINDYATIYIKVNDDEVLEEEHEIEKAIRNAAPYSHVKKNKTASNNDSFISENVFDVFSARHSLNNI